MIAAALADWGFEASLAWEPVPASDSTVLEERILQWPLPRRSSRRREIERREGVQLEEGSTTDVAALPGRVITTDLLQREANKKSLLTLIDLFLTQPLTWAFGEPSRISEETRLAASRFIELLPDEVALPRIAPDGEGGLVMHWEQRGGRHVLGGVEGWQLHFVVDAGQANAFYLDDLVFSRDRIPVEVVDRLMQ